MSGHVRFADTAAVSSGALTIAAWLADAEVYLRICATLVAILAGICAALYHYEGWRQRRAERKRRLGGGR